MSSDEPPITTGTTVFFQSKMVDGSPYIHRGSGSVLEVELQHGAMRYHVDWSGSKGWYRGDQLTTARPQVAN